MNNLNGNEIRIFWLYIEIFVYVINYCDVMNIFWFVKE